MPPRGIRDISSIKEAPAISNNNNLGIDIFMKDDKEPGRKLYDYSYISLKRDRTGNYKYTTSVLNY